VASNFERLGGVNFDRLEVGAGLGGVNFDRLEVARA
jgi:hypothetical protein